MDCFCTLPEKLLNNLKPKQTFYESIFCLKIINCQILMEFLYNMSQSFANETQIDKFRLNC